MISGHTNPIECDNNVNVNCIKNPNHSLKTNGSDGEPGDTSLREKDDELIHFINFSREYCVGFIDIINSTLDTSKIKESKKNKTILFTFP